MEIKKEYPLYTLTDDPNYINWRIRAIEDFTKGDVYFLKDKEKITRITRKIKGKKPLFLNDEHLHQIAEQLDLSHQHGLVHGDIHPKNILISSDKAIIIDWEPSLKQIIGNINTLMFTAPWISPEDKKDNTLSLKTDLLCFYNLIKKQRMLFFQSNDWENLQKKSIYSKIPFTTILTLHKEYTNGRRKKQTF